MNGIKIENIVANAQISEDLNIQDLVEKIPELIYNPDDFKGATYKLDYPKTAVLILPSGKVICTGAINMEQVEQSIRKLTEKMMKVGININTNPTIETQNIVASTDIYKELDLNFISKSLLMKNVNYEPDQFPGLIYNMDDVGIIVLVFCSGKIVSTGAKSFEDASKAIEMMKDKLSSFGIL
jgi:transcription initiation factor TFIID TATA-box-binding protein